MCLRTKEKDPFVATEDIVCYKCYFRTKNKFVYKPICYPFTGRKLVCFNGRTVRAKGKKNIWKENGLYGIDVGFIHTYTIEQLYDLHMSSRFAIWKAIIPKGTKYYKSIDGKEYCSEKIKLIEIYGKIKTC